MGTRVQVSGPAFRLAGRIATVRADKLPGTSTQVRHYDAPLLAEIALLNLDLVYMARLELHSRHTLLSYHPKTSRDFQGTPSKSILADKCLLSESGPCV